MKKYNLYVIALLAIFSFGSCSSPQSKPGQQQQQKQEPSKSAEMVNSGKNIFEEKCVVCHGADGAAGIAGAADLRISKSDTVSVIRMITQGKNSMPAFVDQLGAGEIDQVTNYIFTLRK